MLILQLKISENSKISFVVYPTKRGLCFVAFFKIYMKVIIGIDIREKTCCVILDLFSQKVVGNKVSLKSSAQVTKSTFKQAYYNRNPEGKLIFHSDRGGEYLSKTSREYLEKLHVEQSFLKTHVPYDNSVAKSFFS